LRSLAVLGMAAPGGLGSKLWGRLGLAGLAATVGTGLYPAGSGLSAQPGFKVDPEQITSGLKAGERMLVDPNAAQPGDKVQAAQ
jgi:hypothetical protein